MDKDRLKGKVTDISGRIKRQAGEWTGDKELQTEGAGEQIKGKAQNTVGKAKDIGRNVMRDARAKKDKEETRAEDRPRKKRAA